MRRLGYAHAKYRTIISVSKAVRSVSILLRATAYML